MKDEIKPRAGPLASAISGVFLVAGGILFLFGDRYLREIEHMDVWLAELGGIGGGLVLMVLGGLLKMLANQKDS